MTRDEHAHVVAPPPLLYLGGVLAAVLLDWYWPIALLPPALAPWLAVPAVLLGLAVNVWGVYTMRRARTAINPYGRTTHIVDTGPFTRSRNPLYVGMDLVFAGVVGWINTLWGVPLFILVLVVMHYGVIRREERYLEKEFGGEYHEYCARVRRYL